MVVEVVVSIIAKIAEFTVAPVGRQCGYLIFYERNIKHLEKQVQQLEDRRENIRIQVDAAKRNREKVGRDVERWLKTVDKLDNEAQKILQSEVETTRKGCLRGWCPNLKSRYSVSRKATYKAAEVGEKYVDGNFSTITYGPAPPPGIESRPTGTVGHQGGFESRRLVTDKVMKALKDDKINMIGICGMGGVGKTTMAKEVGKRAKEENLFDEVVMAVVSQNTNARRIQGEIADMLGLKLEQESVSGRADGLRARLKNIRRILVILDDVWKSLEMNEKIGIPFGDDDNDHKGCKILLTSRNQDVCNHMGAQKIFPVDVLSEEEAWNMFREKAGISISSALSGITTSLHSTQMAVAEESGGLPIAIVTVATALKGKDESNWNDALRQLRRCIARNIREFDARVFSSLELSYNYLQSEEAKKCFLLCSLFPEGFNIPIEDLVRYGYGLELFEGIDNVGESRDRVHVLVDDLKKCHLLMDSKWEECVKMHDVIRDVAILIASRDEHRFMVRCNEALDHLLGTNQDKNHSVISLRCTGMHGMPDNLEFPNLRLLRLEYNNHSKLPNTPDSFYGGTKNVQVIDLFYIGIVGSLPTSLRSLSNLRTLSLRGCRLIDGDISVIGALKNLEMLSFTGSRIKELPREIGHLTQLKLLDLRRCIVQKIYSGVLSSLTKLEELYVGAAFLGCDVIGESNNVVVGESKEASIAHELASLPNLVALDIYLEYMPRDLVLEKLRNFNIIVGQLMVALSFYNYLLPNQFTLCSLSLNASDNSESGLELLLKSTKILYLKSVNGLKNIPCDGFDQLIELLARDCDDLEYLINTTNVVLWKAFPVLQLLKLDSLNNFKGFINCYGQLPKEAFSGLKELSLYDLPQLTHLWKGPTQLVWLGNLTSVEVERCFKLESVFPVSIARNLMQLEKLKITRCSMMEVIVSSEGGEREIATAEKIEFPKLNGMFLRGLPSLTAICKAVNGIELPQLRQLELQNIPKMKSLCPASERNYDPTNRPLFDNKLKMNTIENLTINLMDNLREIWPGELKAKLREMNVFKCHKLLNILFPSNSIKGIQNLEILEVMDCRSMEVAFDLEGLTVMEGHSDMLLPSLTIVKLGHLPKLKHIWKSKSLGIQGFQNLRSLKVKGCDSLRNLFSSSLAKLLVKLQEIEVIKCVEIEAIVAEEPKVDDEVTTSTTIFPQLISLELKHLPKLWSFCSQDYWTSNESSLKTLKVINCPKLKALPSAFQPMLELQRYNARSP